MPKVPSTSLSSVEAVLPVILVLSIVAVPKVAMPPPMPTPARVQAVPFRARVCEAVGPLGVPLATRSPHRRPARPAGPWREQRGGDSR